eukprot:340558_1
MLTVSPTANGMKFWITTIITIALSFLSVSYLTANYYGAPIVVHKPFNITDFHQMIQHVEMQFMERIGDNKSHNQQRSQPIRIIQQRPHDPKIINNTSMNNIQLIQSKIDNVTSLIQQQQFTWGNHSDFIKHDWNSANLALFNKTILFIGDSTMRNTFAYFVNCVCIKYQSEYNECSNDQLFIQPKKHKNKFVWSIHKGQSHKQSMIQHCPKYHATIVWHKLWATDIQMKIATRITKNSDLNLLNVSESVITNPTQDANGLVNRLKQFEKKTDILIWNQGMHLQVELRRTNPVYLQMRASENIALLVYYEFYMNVFKKYVWNRLRRSNESCLFFQTTQPQNCEMIYGDRLYLFKTHKNDTIFHRLGFKDWDDYIQQCSNAKNIPKEICEQYWTCNEHKPLNKRMMYHVKNKLQTIDPYSKVFVSDVGHLLQDADFCHTDDFIHKLKCSGAKTYYYAKIVDIASC